MGLYGDYIQAARDSGNPAEFVKQYASPVEVAASLGEVKTTQPHNVAPVNSKLKNYVAPSGTVNKASQYYQSGAKARAEGTNKYGKGGSALAESVIGAKAAKVYEGIADYYNQYKAGTMSRDAFVQQTGTTPEIWEQSQAVKRSNDRAEINAQYAREHNLERVLAEMYPELTQEELHLKQAQLEEANINPYAATPDPNAINAAYLAQLRGINRSSK